MCLKPHMLVTHHTWQVVDASGCTDKEGRPVSEVSRVSVSDPCAQCIVLCLVCPVCLATPDGHVPCGRLRSGCPVAACCCHLFLPALCSCLSLHMPLNPYLVTFSLHQGEGADPLEDIQWVREELHRWGATGRCDCVRV